MFSVSLLVRRYNGFSKPSTSLPVHFNSSFGHRSRGRVLSTDCCCKDNLKKIIRITVIKHHSQKFLPREKNFANLATHCLFFICKKKYLSTVLMTTDRGTFTTFMKIFCNTKVYSLMLSPIPSFSMLLAEKLPCCMLKSRKLSACNIEN